MSSILKLKHLTIEYDFLFADCACNMYGNSLCVPREGEGINGEEDDNLFDVDTAHRTRHGRSYLFSNTTDGIRSHRDERCFRTLCFWALHVRVSRATPADVLFNARIQFVPLTSLRSSFVVLESPSSRILIDVTETMEFPSRAKSVFSSYFPRHLLGILSYQSGT